MVSTGTVNSDKTNIEKCLDEYSQKISGISSSIWEGKSFDNLKANAETIASEYKKIGDQLSSFSKAAGLAQTYNETKEKYNNALNKKNSWNARQSADTTSNPYTGEVNKLKNQLAEIESNIKNTLSGI